MQCERAHEFFSEYLEQALDRPMRVALEAHLARCPACREELESLETTIRALNQMPPVEPPPDGAWQVICRLREADALPQPAPARTLSFLDWLRALSPARVAFGAGLATLVVGGTLIVTGIEHTKLMTLPVPQEGVASAPSAVARPRLTVAYGPHTPMGASVELRLWSPAALSGVQLAVSGDVPGLPWTARADLLPAQPLRVPLTLPAASPAEVLEVAVSAPSLAEELRYLVALPIRGAEAGPLTLVLDRQPLAQALHRLAPSLDRPVFVEAAVGGTVTIGVENVTARRCLEEIAAQVGAQLVVEPDGYRLVPVPAH